MKKLLIPVLLLASCFGHFATAQKASPKKVAPASSKTKLTTALPQTTVTEFCTNYSRYFQDLPQQYQLNAFHVLKAAGANLSPDAALASQLANSSRLREAAYQSLYDFNAEVKFMYNASVKEVVFLTLYRTLHMRTGPATILTDYIVSRYRQPTTEPIAKQSREEPAAAEQSAPMVDGDWEGESTPKQAESKNKVYTYVEQMPELPGGGGNTAIKAALQKNVQYPTEALRNRIEGRVFVSFCVNEQGNVTDVKIEKGLSHGLDEEVSRAVRLLPKFQPGKQSGKAVTVAFTVPVTFTLPVSAAPAP